ncbi:hypothetical protein P9G84_31385 [Brevibacillus centrosporus]|uniref:hypothetical protein n=1 Tax=Brevibacillus centrosporus TaxID=54910 RepID=UPI00114218F8|nr:hypothetical protein [Brevibacillus centrosporus]MEC2133361.1 hypothetical protein [Brevibacillus centrosporus]GED34533.1 hypothetical protein BCE02nite_56740 [Brevibacillus centrosporus]
MTLNVHDVERSIKEKIQVDDHLIAEAKGYILNNCPIIIDVELEITKYTELMGYPIIDSVVIPDTGSIESQILQVAGFYKFYIAFGEALYQLMHAGYYIPNYVYNNRYPFRSVEYTTKYQSSNWNFEEYTVPLPGVLMKAFSKRRPEPTPFTDPNLYLLTAGLLNAHEEVREALSDSIKCFRNELYRSAATMLGKAAEGAWIELGLALSNRLNDAKEAEDYKEKLLGDRLTIAQKISKVVEMFLTHHKDEFKYIKNECSVGHDALRGIEQWSDVIRNSRNSIHYLAKPVIENTYTKTSVLLMQAAQYFQLMYKMKEIADRGPLLESGSTAQ